MRAKQTFPVVVPAHGSATVEFSLWVHLPEPFEQILPLYLEDDGVCTVEVRVWGEGAPDGTAGEQP